MFGAAAAASQTPTVSTAGAMLDGLGAPTPLAAYSLDKIVGSYTGSAIRIRRTNDGAQLDIGFTSAGVLNTSAISSHCGSASGYVVTWYDQTGQGRHLTQATTTAQFRIYNGTTTSIETTTRNSITKPCLYAVDQDRGMITAAFTATNTATAVAAVVGVIQSGTTDNSPRFVSLLPSTTTLGDVEAPGAVMIGRNGDLQEWGLNRNKGWRASTPGTYNTVQSVVSQISSNSYSVTVDGVPRTGTYDAGVNIQASRIGMAHTGFEPQSVTGMRISELIVWAVPVSSAIQQALQAAEWTRFGITQSSTPVTPTTDGLDWDALGYDIIYEEDFTTSHSYTIDATTYVNTVDPDDWTLYGVPAGTTPGNDGVGFRNPNKVKVANGVLRIEGVGDVGGGLSKKNVDGSNSQYTSGDIRFRTYKGHGYDPKITLFPVSGNWPAAGSVDLVQVPQGDINNTLVSQFRNDANTETKTIVGDWTTWHTVSWTWTETAFDIYLDGVLFYHQTSSALLPQEAMQLVLGLNVGDGDPIAMRDSTTPQPAFLEIDYIRLTRKPGLPGGGSGGGFTDLPEWNLLFVEEFNTLAAEGQFLAKYPNWGAYGRGYKDTYGGQPGRPIALQSHYEPNIISVAASADGISGNVMKFRLQVGTEPLAGAPADNKPWGAAPYPRLPGKGNCRQTYGRYEARVRVISPKKGWKTAWLLWNTRNDLDKDDPKYLSWPYAGEVDWPEGSLVNTMDVFHHNYRGTSGSDQVQFKSGQSFTSWHDVVMEWKPNFMRFLVDGVVVGTVTSRVCPDEMRWVLQTETNLGNPRPIAGEECIVEIARVGVWAYAGD